MTHGSVGSKGVEDELDPAGIETTARKLEAQVRIIAICILHQEESALEVRLELEQIQSLFTKKDRRYRTATVDMTVQNWVYIHVRSRLYTWCLLTETLCHHAANPPDATRLVPIKSWISNAQSGDSTLLQREEPMPDRVAWTVSRAEMSFQEESFRQRMDVVCTISIFLLCSRSEYRASCCACEGYTTALQHFPLHNIQKLLKRVLSRKQSDSGTECWPRTTRSGIVDIECHIDVRW